MQYFRPHRHSRPPGVRTRPRRISTPLSPTTRAAPVSIPCFRPFIGEEEIEAATAVLRSGWLTTGPKAREFEQSFVAYMGDGVEAVAVNSATAGLHLAAEACGIGPGDEVILPTLTFTATASVIRHLGAEVVLADVEERTRCIDLDDAERRLTSRCKAIMPVHFGGLPCNMTKILAFARRHGLKVIEDAAHALPARWDGRLIGSLDSDACVFSFYACKPITTGEGGMIVTRDPNIAARARVMRTHGLDRDSFDRFRKVGASWAYDVIAPGFKYNLTDVAAAIGIVQLTRAAALQASRQRAAERYLEKLAALPIDWANVNWPYFLALVILVFGCTFVGTALSMKRTFLSCLLTSLLFGAAFMFWTYYPHNLPLPMLDKPDTTAATGTAAQRPYSSGPLRDPTYR